MPRTPGRANLNEIDRARLLTFLAARTSECGELKHGAVTAAATTYDYHRNTVRAVWSAHWKGDDKITVKPVRGRPPKYSSDDVMKRVEEVPVRQRTTMRSTAAAAAIPKSTLQRHIGKGSALRRTTVYVIPTLKPDQKLARLRFALSFVERPLGLRSRYFDDMSDVVHVDEKWFFVHKVSSSFILSRDEQPPHLSCTSKRFITTAMFLAAVARPRYDYARKHGFDGKIGIFPIVQQRVAQRTTQNQTRGELITVPLSADKDVYASLYRSGVIPAIMAKWPGTRSKTIWLQQDNATPRVLAERVALEASVDGWDVRVKQQPPMSPYMNFLDLGFCHAIQTLQRQKHAYSVPELVKAVQIAFAEMEVSTLEKCFLTLQAIMEQAMLAGGGND